MYSIWPLEMSLGSFKILLNVNILVISLSVWVADENTLSYLQYAKGLELTLNLGTAVSLS